MYLKNLIKTIKIDCSRLNQEGDLVTNQTQEEKIANLEKRLKEIENKNADELWLEVSKVRRQEEQVFIQVIGDKNDRPVWWEVIQDKNQDEKKPKPEPKPGWGKATYDAIAKGIDTGEQTVIARLEPKDDNIVSKTYRIQTK